MQETYYCMTAPIWVTNTFAVFFKMQVMGLVLKAPSLQSKMLIIQNQQKELGPALQQTSSR